MQVGPCISTRAELEGKISRQRHRESPGPTPFSDGEKAAVLDLAYKVIATHQEHFVITVPSMLSALVLYWSYMHGSSTATVDAVVDACERVCREVLRRGYRIDVQPRDATDTVSSIRGGLAAGLPGWLNPLHPAAVIAGPVLDFSGAMPTKYIVDLDSLPHDPVFGTILLGHQRNEIVHVFAAEALAVAAVLTAGACSAAASKTSAYAEFRYLHDLLEIEFILRWKTDEDARAAFDAALDRLTLSGALTVDCDTITLTGDWFVTFLASMILPFVLSSTVVAEWWLANPTARLNLVRDPPPPLHAIAFVATGILLTIFLLYAGFAVGARGATIGVGHHPCARCKRSQYHVRASVRGVPVQRYPQEYCGSLADVGSGDNRRKKCCDSQVSGTFPVFAHAPVCVALFLDHMLITLSIVPGRRSVDRLVKINGRTRRAAAAITTAVRGASVVGAKM
jgi:hypothetical protein